MAPSKKLQEAKPAQSAEPARPAERMVVMGHITGPYGLLGWVKVAPHTEYIDGLLDYPEWWLGKDDGEWRRFRVLAGEVHGSLLLASLEPYTDRTSAMQLKGLQVAIPRSRLPALPESGEEGYYWSDLIGLAVVNLQDEELGRVIGLLETGANEVLQVQSMEGSERLIPFIDHVIVKVDFEANRITVDWGKDY